MGLALGEFKAVAGRRYAITARVLKLSPGTQVLDPHLQVALNHILAPNYNVPAGIAQVGGLIAAVVGLALLGSAVTLTRSQR